MSEEQAVTQAAPEGETAASTPAMNETDTGAVETTTTTQTTPEPEAKPEGESEKRTPWFQRRIDELTRQRYEAQREAEAYRAALDAMRQPATGEDPAQPKADRPLTQADIDRMVNERAHQVAAAEKFNAECNSAFEKGKEAFPDFEQTLGIYRDLGGLKPEFVEAALSTGEAHRVLYELGKNPDEAMRVMSLPPVKQAVELAKLALKPNAAPKAKPVSNAPAPVRPIDGAARVSDNPDAMSMEQFIAWREKNAK